MKEILDTSRKKIFAFAALLVMIIAFNWSNGRAVKLEQIRFEDWLRNNQLVLSNDGNYRAPELEITLNLSAAVQDSPAIDLKLSSGKSPDQVQRILSLAKEAKLFSNKKSSAAKDPHAIQLSIQQGATSFAAAIDQERLEENLQTKTLVKLFEIYAKQNQS